MKKCDACNLTATLGSHGYRGTAYEKLWYCTVCWKRWEQAGGQQQKFNQLGARSNGHAKPSTRLADLDAKIRPHSKAAEEHAATEVGKDDDLAQVSTESNTTNDSASDIVIEYELMEAANIVQLPASASTIGSSMERTLDRECATLTSSDCGHRELQPYDAFFDFERLESMDVFSEARGLSAMPDASSADDFNEALNSLYVIEHRLGSEGIVRINELPLADGVHASTGCQLWPASVALGQLLCEMRSLIAGKSVLELGAGCGFAGIVAARFAARTIITDADKETVDNLHLNLRLNRKFWLEERPGQPPSGVSAETVVWQDVVKKGWPSARRVDVVIGSDIIYGNWGDVVTEVVRQVLLPGGIVLMIHARDRGGLSEFQRSMEHAGFDFHQSDWRHDGKSFLFFKCGERQLQERRDAHV